MRSLYFLAFYRSYFGANQQLCNPTDHYAEYKKMYVGGSRQNTRQYGMRGSLDHTIFSASAIQN